MHKKVEVMMAEYAVTNPLADNLAVRSGPGVIFDQTASFGPGKQARGDFIFTYQTALTTDGRQRSAVNDQWVHLNQLDGVAIDGWTAIIHLGKPYAAAQRVTDADLTVSFGVDLEGYNPITLTGTLTPR
jgi:hypothetical protein